MSTASDVYQPPKVSFWNDPKIRSALVQVIMVLVVGFFVYEIVDNTITNLTKRNISTGFGFLNKSAGFDLIQTLIAFSSESSYGRALFAGFLNTLMVSCLGILFATLLGFIIGIMRLSRNWLVSSIATLYIETIRNVPVLLQMFVWYGVVLKSLPGPRQAVNIGDMFFLSNRGLNMPDTIFGDSAWLALAGLAAGIIGTIVLRGWARKRQAATGQPFPYVLTGIAMILALPFLGLVVAGWPVTFDYPVLGGFNFTGGTVIIPEFMALLVALSIYTASFIAEIVRAGIQAVSHGQSEAAHALGMRSGITTRLVVIPQAMRVIIPPLASQYLNLTKNSSLAVAIGYPDLVATGGTVLNQTGQAIEIVMIWMVVYLSLSLLTSSFMNWFNSRMKLVER
ncbi:MAG TPA: amino acid ABC transporter permease [Aestuariivirga sp.]|nr:amino acid ABC transporter permease [Aestuariivirga sp.]